MSTIVTRAGKGSPLTHNEVDANFNNLNNDKYQSGSSPSFAGTTLSSGNLTFSSTGQRITGDMSNATVANRLLFQTSTANSNTEVGIIPSGTGTASVLNIYPNSDPSNTGYMRLACLTTDVRFLAQITGTGTYLPMTFYTGGSERLRLDTSGNLLVGTSGQIARLGVVNPTGGYGFAIQGQATDGQSILSSMDRSGTVYTGNITFPEDGSILFGRLNTGSQTTRMTIDSSGNVGIGTASPGTKLSVSSATNAGISVTDGTVTTIMYNSTGGVASIGTTSNHSVNLLTNNTTRVTFDSSGNVGIGTASPVSKLDIISGTARVYVSNQSDTGFITAVNTTNTAYAPLAINGSSVVVKTGDAARMTVDSSGNVGIGGTAAASVKLSLSGTAPSSSNLTFGYYQNMSLPSTTTSAYLNYTVPSIASSATVTTLGHFYAAQGTFTGSATNQYGFVAESTLTGATNNYGFYSNIASGSNRWNFYAAGTAKNYFAGQVGINKDPSAQLNVSADSGTIAYFQNSGGTGIYINAGDNTWTSASDERLKTDLAPIESAIEKLSFVRAVIGRYKNDNESVSRPFLIAQDVQKVFPQAVSDNNPDELGLRYSEMIPLLVAAIKELSAKVAALEAK